MNKHVINGTHLPQREFVYYLWDRAFDTEGNEDLRVGRNEILEKTSTVIYAHSTPYLGEEYERKKEKYSFEISRKEIERLGWSYVRLRKTTFYLSEEAARAAIPKRVQLAPAQVAYFGLTKAVTRQELNLAYCQLAYSLDPVMGGSAEAFSELMDHYQAALRTIGQ